VWRPEVQRSEERAKRYYHRSDDAVVRRINFPFEPIETRGEPPVQFA